MISTCMRRFSSAVKKSLEPSIVGLNIYCDEVLFDAELYPHENSNFNRDEMKTLNDSIRKIMPLAVKMGGSSVANYVLGDGSNGSYADKHMVYNRKALFSLWNHIKKNRS